MVRHAKAAQPTYHALGADPVHALMAVSTRSEVAVEGVAPAVVPLGPCGARALLQEARGARRSQRPPPRKLCRGSPVNADVAVLCRVEGPSSELLRLAQLLLLLLHTPAVRNWLLLCIL
jgi:hypothetical protein